MNKKLIGILICILFFGASVVTSIGVDIKQISKNSALYDGKEFNVNILGENVTYYFDSEGLWPDNWGDGEYIVDNNLDTFGYTEYDNDYHRLTENTCPGTNLEL